MPAPRDPVRHELAKKRLLNILRKHGVASSRILEQKISDAGPTPQRINPHVLTPALKELLTSGVVAAINHKDMPWYHLNTAEPSYVSRRFAELTELHDRTATQDFGVRCGQALEIQIFRGLVGQSSVPFMGGFRDLADHDDATPYSKDEPPQSVNGRTIPGRKLLDFVGLLPHIGAVGIEAKNVRQWMYPQNEAVKELLFKCCHLNAVPVLIARRIPYVTFTVFRPTGLLIHQTYNQLYPVTDSDLAALASDKNLLGYHDIRLADGPDARLLKFLHKDLPSLLPAARARFDAYADLLMAYGSGEMPFPEFAARTRRRDRGQPEDGWDEWEPEEDEDDYFPF